MRFMVRTGILIAQLAAFFVLMALISLGTTYLTAERYAEGSTPVRLFPVISLPPGAANPPRYELLRWPDVTRKDPPPPPRELRLPEPAGEFDVPARGGFAPMVRFAAHDAGDGRQRVELRVTEDDYVIYAAYVTDGGTVAPEYFRVWGPSSALLAVFPAFVLALVLGRLLRRRFMPPAKADAA
ncbi:MAG: hypothetical protein KF804_07195 [Burkholderiales bacterium]|jgi:hypothetical protein|nr:hypothetical protein [Burkholderiales bacterium]